MNFALTTAALLFAALIGSASCQLQYDDLSVLGEVVEGSGVEVAATTEAVTTTTTQEKKEEATTTTVTSTEAQTTTEATTTQAPTTVAETTVESTTTEAATTTEATTTTEEPTTETTTQGLQNWLLNVQWLEFFSEVETTTAEVLIPDTTPTEEVDEESFLGFKKPDLATIYRRLFPFQHHPGQKQGQYRQGQFGQQGGF